MQLPGRNRNNIRKGGKMNKQEKEQLEKNTKDIKAMKVVSDSLLRRVDILSERVKALENKDNRNE